MTRAPAALIWLALACAIGVPLALAASSPLLAWRDPIYIIAGFAGVIGLALILLQPLLAAGLLPGLTPPRARRIHRTLGLGLLASVLLHVAGLWITSPPDVIDALTFTSPTPFSAWGVIAMWAVIGSALLALNRRRIRWRTWRTAHTTLATIIVAGTIIHAVLIQGTMEPLSKYALCALTLAATAKALWGLRS